MSRKTFHYRDPAKTPVLKLVFECCYRREGDNRPAPTGLDIMKYTSERGHITTRPPSDVSELRFYFQDRPNAETETPTHYVCPAEYVGKTEAGARVSRFAIYRWADPRAVEARRAEAMKSERTSRRAAA